MAWTNEQQQVIGIRDKNMLVSAAAGSGKTAVLVERIIAEILNEDSPVDVDRILVVTFTNAAAAEMKARVRKAIDQALRENPKRADIRKQATLVHNAQIRTIDSFCSWLVKNYFYEIDQDPGFRIGSKGELDMLCDSVISDLIAQRFEEGDEDFKLLADAYIDGLKVESLKKQVFALYHKAMSYPWPLQWCEDSLKLYELSSPDELRESSLVEYVVKKAISIANESKQNIIKAMDLFDDTEAPVYKVLASDYALYDRLSNANDYDELYSILAGAQFQRFSSSKKGISEEDKVFVKSVRDSAKETIEALKKDYFLQSLDEIFEQVIYTSVQAKALLELTKDYILELKEAKKKRNVYDFNDIEHMALCILRDEADKEHGKRPVAIELSQYFVEVMVDEYQDSNELQESILTALTKGNNYFTVGDVKQSIYAFRQASPKLFMEKFESYNSGEPSSVRIDLDKNFRSRAQVLDFTNDVFLPLMRSDMGKVEYDQAATLKAGAEYYPENGMQDEPELLIGEYDGGACAELVIKDSDSFEAQMIADRINGLFAEGFQVTTDDPNNKNAKLLRKLEYRDIVILMRAVKTRANTYIQILQDNNIPACVEEEEGFFDRDEIQTVLAFLEVLDNPYNDISLAATLHSPMFFISSEKLARIRCFNTDKNISFFDCLRLYNDSEASDSKIASFFRLFEELQDMMIDRPIHEIIMYILKETGYEFYVSSLPNGNMAKANLDKLIDEAISFEKTSYRGLSKFVTYINDLKSYKEELGLAKIAGEQDNVVRIMTIHKSKGLEFPVVFVGRCGGKLLNEKYPIVYHDETGFAMDYKNPISRVATKSFFANITREFMKNDALGEEQRILYVALTRAKEKLILTGLLEKKKDSSVSDIIDEYSRVSRPDKALLLSEKENAKCYYDWILRALSVGTGNYNKRIIKAEDLLISEIMESTNKHLFKEELLSFYQNLNKQDSKYLDEIFSFQYQYKSLGQYKSKYSVSEIKHQAMEENFMDEAQPAFLHRDEESFVPEFISKREVTDNTAGTKKTEPSGALYGSAMHRFMECFDFAVDSLQDEFQNQYDFMVGSKQLTEAECKLISLNRLKGFFESEIAERMRAAALEGKLYKEQPFVFGALPEQLFLMDDTRVLDENLDEMVLVQGIIDVFFEETDGFVLLDYKTDKVDDTEELVLRYEKQLLLYKDAIERAYKKPVKAVYIYSFSLGCQIRL